MIDIAKQIIYFLNFHIISYSNILIFWIILLILKLLIRLQIYMLYNKNKKFILFPAKDNNIYKFLNQIIQGNYLFKYNKYMEEVIIKFYQQSSPQIFTFNSEKGIFDYLFNIGEQIINIDGNKGNELIFLSFKLSIHKYKENQYCNSFLFFITDYELKIIFFLEYIDFKYLTKNIINKIIMESIYLKIILIFFYLLIMY